MMVFFMKNLKKIHESGRERKCKAPEIIELMFQWFINVREVLNGHLPI